MLSHRTLILLLKPIIFGNSKFLTSNFIKMKKLILHKTAQLQGNFNLKKKNILFVFQVNCPGCFIYGFPTLNNLYQKFRGDVGFLGLSTAFEDFNYNTIEHTKLLLKTGNMVGETKKFFAQQGIINYAEVPRFPIAFDEMATFDALDLDVIIANLKANYPKENQWDATNISTIKRRFVAYYKTYESIPLTFTYNQLRGTPSYIIYDDSYTVLFHHFGHIDPSVLVSQLEI